MLGENFLEKQDMAQNWPDGRATYMGLPSEGVEFLEEWRTLHACVCVCLKLEVLQSTCIHHIPS